MDFDNEDFANNHCKHIRELDPLIRFVGIANGMGTLVGTSYREQLNPLMDDEALQSLNSDFRGSVISPFERLSNAGTGGAAGSSCPTCGG